MIKHSKIAFFAIFSLFFASLSAQPGESSDHSVWDRILKQHVQHGRVDYQGLLQVRTELDDYLKQLEAVSADELSEAGREERIAFWINLYNASVIRTILDEYPIERFDQIPAAFEVRTIRTIGEFFSLSELRDQILRQGFHDERILTALVSGRMDSPKLLEEAFRGENLEMQLNRVAREFVEDDNLNRIKPGEKKIFLSPLFNHFGSDFLLNFSSADSSSGFSQVQMATVSFLLHHVQNPEKRLFLNSGRYKIRYLAEDPRLNDVRNLSKGNNGS